MKDLKDNLINQDLKDNTNNQEREVTTIMVHLTTIGGKDIVLLGG
jgi:hypothetical protein